MTSEEKPQNEPKIPEPPKPKQDPLLTILEAMFGADMLKPPTIEELMQRQIEHGKRLRECEAAVAALQGKQKMAAPAPTQNWTEDLAILRERMRVVENTKAHMLDMSKLSERFMDMDLKMAKHDQARVELEAGSKVAGQKAARAQFVAYCALGIAIGVFATLALGRVLA